MPQQRDTALRIAIDACYAAFRVPKPVHVEGCPCCSSPSELARLLEVPLRDLEADDLGRYLRKAMTTIGTVDDFRYFFPRLADLVLSGRIVEIEIFGGKLADGQWTTWPDVERAAVRALIEAMSDAFAEMTLNDPDAWLCAIGRASQDIRPHLDKLLLGTPAAKANLGAIIEANEDVQSGGSVWNPYWNEAPENRDAVITWMTSEAVLAKWCR